MKLLVLVAFILLTNCINIPVYIHDKHTVMEMEASSKWHDFDEEFSSEVMQQGSQQLEEIPKSLKEKKAFSILNGEFYQQKKDRK